MKKQIKLALLSVSALITLASCKTNEDNNSSSQEASSSSASSSEASSSAETISSSQSLEEKIEIEAPRNTTLMVGDEVKLVYKIINKDEVPGRYLVWHSTNEEVLTVDSEGLVKAISKGEAEIYVNLDVTESNRIKFVVENKVESDGYPIFTQMLSDYLKKDQSKISQTSVSVKNDEYNYHEDSETNEYVNTISYSKGEKWNNKFYSDKKLEIENIKSESNEADIKSLHRYGIANNLLIDAAFDYGDDAYSFNNSKSSSKEISNQDEADSFLNIGKVSESSGAINYILDNFFSGDQNFSSLEARKTSKLETEGNTYTLTSSEVVKDNVDQNVYMEYSMSITLDSNGYITSLNGHIKSYNSDQNGEKLRLTTDKTIELSQEISDRAASEGIDFDSYFFKTKNELSIILGENPYSTTSVSSFALNTKYYIVPVAKIASRSNNIDKLQFVKITNGEEEADAENYELDGMAITFKKAGNYTLSFKTTLLTDLTATASIVSHEVTSLSFSSKPAWIQASTWDNNYLSSNILAGDTSFTLVANDGANDDTSVEFVSNDIGATISKDTSASFAYVLHTEKAGTITLKGKSASGVETEPKTITVYPYTDEGIASFLASATWNPLNTSSSFSSIAFDGTNGTFTSVASGTKSTGKFKVEDKVITCTKDKTNMKNLVVVVKAGATGILAGMTSARTQLYFND